MLTLIMTMVSGNRVCYRLIHLVPLSPLLFCRALVPVSWVVEDGRTSVDAALLVLSASLFFIETVPVIQMVDIVIFTMLIQIARARS